MKTDNIFYNLFQLFPELLFELIGEDPSREIKGCAEVFGFGVGSGADCGGARVGCAVGAAGGWRVRKS